MISRVRTFLRHLSYRVYYCKPVVTIARRTGLNYRLRGLYFCFIRWTSAPEEEIHIRLNCIQTRFRVSSLYPGGIFALETLGDERLLLSRLLQIVKSGDIFYDVGAGIGLYTIFLAKRVGNRGRVIAFEPDTERFEMLKLNLQVNDCNNVSVFQTALGRRSSVAHLEEGKPVEHRKNENSEIDRKSIPVVQGDDFVVQTGLPIPSALKIDVEGFEGEVLAGLERVLKDQRCKFLVCEMHPWRLPRETDESTIMAMVRDAGFMHIETLRKSKDNFHIFCTKTDSER